MAMVIESMNDVVREFQSIQVQMHKDTSEREKLMHRGDDRADNPLTPIQRLQTVIEAELATWPEHDGLALTEYAVNVQINLLARSKDEAREVIDVLKPFEFLGVKVTDVQARTPNHYRVTIERDLENATLIRKWKNNTGNPYQWRKLSRSQWKRFCTDVPEIIHENFLFEIWRVNDRNYFWVKFKKHETIKKLVDKYSPKGELE